MEIVKVGLFGMIGVMLALQFKSYKPEYGVYLGVGVCILIFYYVLQCMSGVLGQFQLLQGYLQGGQGYFSVLLKVVGITYICEFSAGICKDAGYQSVAGQIEIVGKLTVLFSGLPILFALLEQIGGLW